jgi:hypothetical protein
MNTDDGNGVHGRGRRGRRGRGPRGGSERLKAGAGQDNLQLAHQGLAAADWTDAQRDKLLALVRVYVGNLADAHADVKMKEVEEHLDDTYFSWIGETDDDSAFYYRVHSPVVLIEYDAQSPLAYGNEDSGSGDSAGGGMGGPGGTPTQQHIHTVIRTPNGGDYGIDLLKLHLENDH